MKMAGREQKMSARAGKGVCVCVFCCVCVCVRILLQITDREQPQVQRNVKCGPFPPNGDVRPPQTEDKGEKPERRCPSPLNVPWVLKKEKKNIKENKIQRKLKRESPKSL